MSNITNSRVFKRIGAGPYLKMLAERDANDKAANVDSIRTNDKKFNSVFDNSNNCVEINNIVNTHSISNYYEYSVTKNDIIQNAINPQSRNRVGDKIQYSVKKIELFEDFTIVSNDVIDFKIIFKGFI